MVLPQEDRKKKPVESRPLAVEEVVAPPVPAPQPVPVAPVREVPVDVPEYVDFDMYGTGCKVRFSPDMRLHLGACSPSVLSGAWQKMAAPEYNNTLADCLAMRSGMNLGDWAYYQLLLRVSKACMGGDGNDSRMLLAFLLCQSGYRTRIGLSGGNVYPLIASRHCIFGTPRFNIGGDTYYAFGVTSPSMSIYEVPFPKEQPLSLLMTSHPLLSENPTPARVLQSQSHGDMKAEVRVNRNLMDFYESYPSSTIGDDMMSRWAMYANMPMAPMVKDALYPSLRKGIEGVPQRDAACRLLNFVQTAFEYGYDDKVWGHDRAFFAEETLHYPYSDCEDRSILFSRLVRDLMGLDVVLVYYLGHVATAVAFDGEVPGDYIEVAGKRYVVSDPTFIGASVGMTMPGMDNRSAKVILLDRGL